MRRERGNTVATGVATRDCRVESASSQTGIQASRTRVMYRPMLPLRAILCFLVSRRLWAEAVLLVQVYCQSFLKYALSSTKQMRTAFFGRPARQSLPFVVMSGKEARELGEGKNFPGAGTRSLGGLFRALETSFFLSFFSHFRFFRTRPGSCVPESMSARPLLSGW